MENDFKMNLLLSFKHVWWINQVIPFLLIPLFINKPFNVFLNDLEINIRLIIVFYFSVSV